MAIETNISWADSTHNFWHGCKKVSAACKFCYMFRDKERYGQEPTQVLRAQKFREPLKWKEPKQIFTCSWSDFFIAEADEWRPEAWEVIKATPQHTWLILTKSPERIQQCLPVDWGEGYPNVWLGVSVENNKVLDRVLHLGDIPAALRFISFEPLLEQLNFTQIELNLIVEKYNWFIYGGESGNEDKDGKPAKYGYRPMQWEWVFDLLNAIEETWNVLGQKPYWKPYHFIKQSGTYLAKKFFYKSRHGTDIKEWPWGLQMQMVPPKNPKRLDLIATWNAETDL